VNLEGASNASDNVTSVSQENVNAALLALAEELGEFCAELVLSGKIPLQSGEATTADEIPRLSADKSA
jgi:hypothetical protein